MRPRNDSLASLSRSRPCCSQRCRPFAHRRPRRVRPSSRARHSARTGNAAGPRHHQRQHGAVHRSELHHQSPEASYFRQPGLGSRLRHEPVPARAAPPPILLHGSAVPQTNPSQRPSFSIAPTDPCSPAVARSPPTRRPSPETSPVPAAAAPSRPSPRPDRFETAICHQYRTLETLTCDRC